MNWDEKWKNNFNNVRLKLITIDPVTANRILNMKLLEAKFFAVFTLEKIAPIKGTGLAFGFFLKEDKKKFDILINYDINEKGEKMRIHAQILKGELSSIEKECFELVLESFILNYTNDLIHLKQELIKTEGEKLKDKIKRFFMR